MGLNNLVIYDPGIYKKGDEIGQRIGDKLIKVYYRVIKVLEDNQYEVVESRIVRLKLVNNDKGVGK